MIYWLSSSYWHSKCLVISSPCFHCTILRLGQKHSEEKDATTL